MNESNINQVCQEAHRYFQREEFGRVARTLAVTGKLKEVLTYMEQSVRLMNQGKPLKSNDSQGGPVVALSSLYMMLGGPKDALKQLKTQLPHFASFHLALRRKSLKKCR